MASTYSSDLKLELMATGENAGTWGTKTNTNLNLIQQAVAGFEQVTLSSGGTLALAMSDATLSNARNMVIKFATATIAASTICTIPDSIEKFYIFDATGLTNPTNHTIKTASGTGFTLDAAKIYAAYSDGTNLKEISLDTLGGTVAAAQIADDAVTTDKILDDAVTYAKMQDTSTNNRVLGAATAGTIGEVQIATDMIADDAVSADKLAHTAVTAGSYTLAAITVDAQGRLTAASSGSVSSSNMSLRINSPGPASGTYTTDSGTSKYNAYLWAGGGGGGGGSQQRTGAPGGNGGYGYYTGSISASTAYPWSAGGGGNKGNSSFNSGAGSGGAGGATTFNSLTTNAGNGGGGSNTNNYGSTGNDGSAPGASPLTSVRTFIIGYEAGAQGIGATTTPNANNSGNVGTGGYLLVYTNDAS